MYVRSFFFFSVSASELCGCEEKERAKGRSYKRNGRRVFQKEKEEDRKRKSAVFFADNYCVTLEKFEDMTTGSLVFATSHYFS